jgi:ketosteroid isomerase-like protein
MTKESTTPDLVELATRSIEALSEGDLDAGMSNYAPNGAFDISSVGMGILEGPEAMRAFWEEWIAAYEDFSVEFDEIHDLGSRVTFAVVIQRGRLRGSSGWVQVRFASVSTWADGLIDRTTTYYPFDIDKARAGAERLADERG